ncbi:hypothetical protein [Blastococcus sp. TF02A-30]|uniref:hypothetical protein n=1 Tax=Blastococcus sp. TF02A-30 TaxID=2250580 RepID=UPI0011BF4441|nr:hypothetical protein [Blastococcus sp. TF02A-30]
MAMTHNSTHKRQTTSTGRVRSTGKYGVLSEHVKIPKQPSTSFVTKLRKVGAGEGTIRRVTGK